MSKNKCRKCRVIIDSVLMKENDQLCYSCLVLHFQKLRKGSIVYRIFKRIKNIQGSLIRNDGYL